MRPEGSSRKGGAERGDLFGGTSRGIPHGGSRGAKLWGRAFPLGDWGEPGERLDELYVWVEQRALRVADWYLADRVWKRRCSRALRLGAAAGCAAGAVLPLLQLSGAVRGPYGAWGYLALLGAAVCVGGDRYFGLTAGWMRDVATAQAVQRRLEGLQYDWAAESIREVLGPTEGSAGEAADRGLSLLRRFSEDLTEIVRAETVDWMLEFRSGSVPLRAQSPPQGSSRQGEHGQGYANGRRFPLPPGFRPSMPQQRPPEGPP